MVTGGGEEAGEREHDAGEVDPGRRARHLTLVDALDEESGHDVHALDGSRPDWSIRAN